MSTVDRWLLPDGVEEILPSQARRIEHLRRTLLNLYRNWGYQLVIPPLMEFTNSLLSGAGADLDTLTFKVVDQLSGKTMGIRADITPQAARIDAHSLNQQGVTRLCYAGSVLHTRPQALLASRSPIQLGAELYGGSELSADTEVISLLLETLQSVGLNDITLDLGHVDIYRSLLAECELDEDTERRFFESLQRKAATDLEAITAGVANDRRREQLRQLSNLHGDVSVLGRAREVIANVPVALAALDELQQIGDIISARYPQVGMYFDLAELRGYDYHTGIVFAAYVPGLGRAVANGGRYDDVGEVFGRARPATGFNTDLKVLSDLVEAGAEEIGAIAAPASEDSGLIKVVAELRAAGECVITSLIEQADPRCDRELVEQGGQWLVQPLQGEDSND